MKIIKKIYKKFMRICTELLLGIVEQIEIKKFLSMYSKEEKILYLLTPNYSNLGDEAIIIGIEQILKEKFSDKLILEFSLEKYRRNKKIIEKLVNKNDIIIIHGGGNFGNLYLEAEELRRDIVKRFVDNKIIVMPQSISFTNDIFGRREIKNSQNIYMRHKNFNIIARDEKSYEYGKKYFSNNKMYLAPDSVLYLEDFFSCFKNNQNREGIILTLRNDKEKILDDNIIKELATYFSEKNIKYLKTDTVISYPMNRETREYEVKNMLRKISSAKLNITDRFHGVIFSVITNTPVIVFKSLDHKIEEGVKWFKHLDWVHYVTTVEEAEKLIDKYMNSEYKVEKEKYELKEKLKEVFFNI